MIDITAIAGMVSSIKAASEITRAMIGLRDAAMIQGKIIELNSVILSAQSSAFEANNTQSELLKEIDELNAKIAQLDAWNAETNRYQLTEAAEGVLTYTVKTGMENGEPLHHLCQAVSTINTNHT